MVCENSAIYNVNMINEFTGFSSHFVINFSYVVRENSIIIQLLVLKCNFPFIILFEDENVSHTTVRENSSILLNANKDITLRCLSFH